MEPTGFSVAILYGEGTPTELLTGIYSVIASQLPNAHVSEQLMGTESCSTWGQVMCRLADEQAISLIITVSLMGPTDSVPDATVHVCHKILQGFGTTVRQLALPTNPAALLWRNATGLRNQTLIVNLPTDVDAVQVSLPALFPAIPNAIKLARRR